MNTQTVNHTSRLLRLNGHQRAITSMEPRIATLLGDSTLLDRSAIDPISLLPPPSVAPRRPLPVEPRPAELFPSGDDARTSQASRRNEYIGNDVYGSVRPQAPLHHRQKSSVPIAEVLNNETPFTHTVAQPPPASSNASTAPFSGRLNDILLDPSQHHANKRRKLDGQTTPPALTGSENTLLTLPKPPQPKKGTRRPRIPPLLQGLHQPPPLPPEGRLFPPITGEGGGFGRDIGVGSALRGQAGLDREKEKERSGEKDIETTNGGREGGKEKENARPELVLVNDKENQSQENAEKSVEKVQNKPKEKLKRNKWTEEETRDLLMGVSRFGIGNWKRILHCPDFKFNSRTAVDLKDRFRTCCPGEGLKIKRKSKPKKKTSEVQRKQHRPQSPSPDPKSADSSAGANSSGPQADSSEKTKVSRQPRQNTHRKGPAELAEMGIQRPFFKTNRRERREFTEEDDENILKGFEKYGPVWHLMRSDPDLGFQSRHPTDLRDRFRIRYPEKYAKAGYKLKLRDEMMLKEKEAEPSQGSAGTGVENQSTDTSKKDDKQFCPISTAPVTAVTTLAPADPRPKTNPILQPLLTGFSAPFDDFTLMSDDDGDGSRSPITLNRNIFQWADANPFQTSTSTTTPSIPAVTSLTADIGFNMLAGMDGIHINPLATLKLPISSFNSTSTTPTYPPTSNPISIPLSITTTTNSAPTSAPIPTPTSTSASKQAMNDLLRTPNLPTIVFPHVPAASARSAMHNLPPPADLLSGLDLDVSVRPEPQNLVLDEGINFHIAIPITAGGNGAGAALAPLLGGGGGGRGGLVADRGMGIGFGEEGLGERSLLNSSI
ncbi:hypothetical protein K469DRAFT_694842 [Zopfia rhizophila CBS 207.26]|uniref:Myb-like domain-containing protein n=1 Tax=Zopfia rhizophila CBS 207.26 TaxID=1314779 RepID=A0A6A6ENF1_9PEZI|nr:hypothetical protein K469DRAFT_694842 [Zopfia rhizophila CBS 207.26]